MRLNEQVVKAAKAPASGYILVKDTELTGFALRVTANDARSFVLTYSIEGRQRRLTVGSWPAWTATAAREKAKELRRAVENGIDPLAVKQERMQAPTVAYIIDQYVTRYLSKKKSGAKLAAYLTRDVVPEWGNWKAADVQRRDVITLVERKAEKTGIAANMLLGVVRSMFNWAIDVDLLQGNPALRVKPPALKKQRDRWLTEEEIKIFWLKLDTAKMAAEFKTAARLILISAQRSGEVLSAEWPEVDVDTAWWTIPAEKAKNGLQHSIPLSSLALDEIKKLQPGRWLFPSSVTQSYLTVAGLSNAIAENQQHFGLRHFTPHDLRRTAATQMTKTCGVSQFLVAKILNHVDKGVTKVYDRYAYDPEKKVALDKWDRELRRILGAPVKATVVEIPA